MLKTLPLKTCVYLPVQQVQAPQFQLHISYFLQNCKKGKPGEMDLPYLKTISQIFYQLQKSRYIDTMQGCVGFFGTIR